MQTRYIIESNVPSANTYHLKDKCYSMYKDMLDMQENVKHMDALLKSDVLKREMRQPVPTPLQTHRHTIYSSYPPVVNVNVIQSQPIIIDIILPDARKNIVTEYAVGKGINAAKLIKKHIPPTVYYR